MVLVLSIVIRLKWVMGRVNIGVLCELISGPIFGDRTVNNIRRSVGRSEVCQYHGTSVVSGSVVLDWQAVWLSLYRTDSIDHQLFDSHLTCK